MTDRGVAYQLWAAVEDERLTRGWTGVHMAEVLGIARNTLANLRTSRRKPEVATVHKIADALGFERVRAERLAGLRPLAPGDPGAVSVRDAIQRDQNYTDKQRQQMLDLLDLFEQVNRAEQAEGRRAS